MQTKYTAKQIDRFWEKVNKDNSNTFYNGSRCWEWTASKNKKGYGLLGILGEHLIAHRFSYILNIGKIPKGLYVLHHCDNRSCVNPLHLFLGTQQDNMNDMVNKGRSKTEKRARGEKHGKHKLSDKQVSEIRKTYKPFVKGYGAMSLAKKYNVVKSTIFQIVKRITRNS